MLVLIGIALVNPMKLNYMSVHNYSGTNSWFRLSIAKLYSYTLWHEEPKSLMLLYHRSSICGICIFYSHMNQYLATDGVTI